jgi:hypothetical protein
MAERAGAGHVSLTQSYTHPALCVAAGRPPRGVLRRPDAGEEHRPDGAIQRAGAGGAST